MCDVSDGDRRDRRKPRGAADGLHRPVRSAVHSHTVHPAIHLPIHPSNPLTAPPRSDGWSDVFVGGRFRPSRRYQIHWPGNIGFVGAPSDAWDAAAQEVLGALHAAQAAKKIRYYGFCNFGSTDMARLAAAGQAMAAGGSASAAHPVSNQLPYNLLWRAIEYGALPTSVANGPRQRASPVGGRGAKWSECRSHLVLLRSPSRAVL